ncbi:MAG: CapA family protein [Desulfurivibrionaceae bacterium]
MASKSESDLQEEISLFLCGDVMTGRGVDQIMPRPSPPRLYEPYVKDARVYVELAEKVNGPIPREVDPDYIWGEALVQLAGMSPDFRIINLETAVTTSENYWPGKGINYRMHPANIDCITAADIDCCVLANNHVLDWGYAGLKETLATLDKAGLRHAGAGVNPAEAESPVILEREEKEGRVVIYSFGFVSSGIPVQWEVSREKPGVDLLPDLSATTIRDIAGRVKEVRRKGDVVVASVHWGGNWGYEITDQEREFAHGLIDEAGIDVFHGHSSHHFKGLEIHRDRPIIYGCGDFLNDYEGIGGHHAYRADLCLMYFPEIDPASGRLKRFQLTPLQIRNFQLKKPVTEDIAWVEAVLNREGRQFGTTVVSRGDGRLDVLWDSFEHQSE